MIETKQELKFYKMADCMMNRGYFAPSFTQRVKNLFYPDYIILFLRQLRNVEFHRGGVKGIFAKVMLHHYAMKLGFSIPPNVFGYGLVIPHYGTIVVGEGNKIGNYAVLHTSTCITAGNKIIGDGFYLSTGAKVIKDINLADNISVAANSVVNTSIDTSNCVLAGMPAINVKYSDPWYVRDQGTYAERVIMCQNLYEKMFSQ